MQLPNSNGLPVNLLAACFNDKVATYKYYWLLSILQSLEQGKRQIPKRELFARMISNAWYTVNYFHVSFGKQDQIQNAIQIIKSIEQITIDERQDIIAQKLISTSNKESKKALCHFDKNVPHWFMSPWFPRIKGETETVSKNRIYTESKSFSENCLYALHKDEIEINPMWIDYLTSNARVLKDFCFWNLVLFLQARNPNVPDIANKLIKAAQRKDLTKQKKEYWKNVFDIEKSIECVFTATPLIYSENNFQIDHFIPHAFVSHDLIWNLIPIERRFNFTKSDKLPTMNIHFDKFYDLQKLAFEINKSVQPNSTFIQEYLSIFPDLDKGFTKDKFRETIQPLVTIASNNGFEFLK